MDSPREHPALEDQEESVRIAVRALGDMRNSAVHASPTTCEHLALFQPLSRTHPEGPRKRFSRPLRYLRRPGPVRPLY